MSNAHNIKIEKLAKIKKNHRFIVKSLTTNPCS